jgi:hypothetical protein
MAGMAVGRAPRLLSQRSLLSLGQQVLPRRAGGWEDSLSLPPHSIHLKQVTDYILAHTQGRAIGLEFEGKSVQKVWEHIFKSPQGVKRDDGRTPPGPVGCEPSLSYLENIWSPKCFMAHQTFRTSSHICKPVVTLCMSTCNQNKSSQCFSFTICISIPNVPFHSIFFCSTQYVLKILVEPTKFISQLTNC